MASGGHATHLAMQTTACTECQRRKQKCSRKWPCQHCQTRKVVHLCQFGSAKNTGTSPRKKTLAPRMSSRPSGQMRERGQADTYDEAELVEEETREPHVKLHGEGGSCINTGLMAMGYQNPGETFRLENFTDRTAVPALLAPSRFHDQIDLAIQQLPPRPYVDLLVDAFLRHANFDYYILHPASFMEQYKLWWAKRLERSSLEHAFTCLLLRVCACALQYHDPDIALKIESELVESTQLLTEKYDRAAQDLSRSIPPGSGGLNHVQELLLGSYWMKSEGKFVDSWHALGMAIREAQEQEMHKPARTGLVPFDIEMRAFVWCILLTWDWQMAVLLTRPLLLDLSHSSIETPEHYVRDSDGGNDDVPSPASQILLRYKLAKRLFADFGVVEQLGPSEVLAYTNIIETWLSTLPPAFRPDPHVQFDTSHSWIPVQRAQLHALAYSLMLHPLKPYLAGRKSDETVRAAGVSCCLSLMRVLKLFFDELRTTNSKFHFITFGVFDTALVLCSALAHDTEGTLPMVGDVANAIADAMHMLRIIHISVPATATVVSILIRVTKKLPILQKSQLAPSKITSTQSVPYQRGAELRAPWDQERTSSSTDLSLTENPKWDEFMAKDSAGTPWQLKNDGNIPAMEFGDLVDWEALDLGFVFPGDTASPIPPPHPV